jgi:glutamyl-tRNA reductase
METSIEWFFDNLKNHEVQSEHYNFYKKAKEIHKQEIIKAAKWMPKPYDNIEFLPELAKQYYKETYEK